MACETCGEPTREFEKQCAECLRLDVGHRTRIAACAARIQMELGAPGANTWARLAADAPVLVWPFRAAPECLRLLSTAGGDEDWLVYVPHGRPSFEHTPGWVRRMDANDSPDRFDLPDGAIVFIGVH